MSLVLPVVAQLEAAGPGTAAALWAARAGTYLALTVVVGFLLCAGWLLREGDDARGAALAPTGVRAMRCAAVAAGLWALAAAGMLLFGLANATARPVFEVLDPAIIRRFLGTRYGAGMTVQAGVAVGVCLLAAAARDRTFVRWTMVGAAGGAVALAASGHASTAPVPPLAVVSNSMHILAVALWVGGLAGLVVLVLRHGGSSVAGPVGRFSRLAGWFLAVVLVTGATNSLMHVGAPRQLLETTWGRLVLVKLVLFAGIAALGWRSRRRLVPRIGAGIDARRTFRKVALAEVSLMVAAFGVATALASGTPARIQAAAELSSIRVEFGDGLVELTLAPARAGVNELHVYFFDATGGLRDTDDVSVTFEAERSPTAARLLPSGPGHYTGPAVELPRPGTYTVTVEGRVEGSHETTTAAFTVR